MGGGGRGVGKMGGKGGRGDKQNRWEGEERER